MKQFLIALGMGTVLALCVHFLAKSIKGSLESEESSMHKYVGKSVVVDGDTMTIVDNSIWSGDYTLSNGLEVDEKFIKLNIVK